MAHDGGKNVKTTHNGRNFVVAQVPQEVDERVLEWDGEEEVKDAGPGKMAQTQEMGKKRPGSDEKSVEWVPEPALEASQCVLLAWVVVTVVLTE